MTARPYTYEERQQIAAEILRYMQQEEIHSYRPTPHYSGTIYTTTTRAAEGYDLAILELTALDVLGRIDLEQLPPRIREIKNPPTICRISPENR